MVPVGILQTNVHSMVDSVKVGNDGSFSLLVVDSVSTEILLVTISKTDRDDGLLSRPANRLPGFSRIYGHGAADDISFFKAYAG